MDPTARVLAPPSRLFHRSFSATLNRHILRFPTSMPCSYDPSELRRVFEEDAEPLGLSNVTFSFPTTEHFAYFLTSLGHQRRRLLRHIFVWSSPLGFYMNGPEEMDCFSTLPFQSILDMFHGLQLDTLTLQDAYHGPNYSEDGWGHHMTYTELEDLIQTGMGWRELRYITMNDAFLKWEPFDTDQSAREDQPHAWNQKLHHRDGNFADVKIFRSKEIWSYGTNLIKKRVDYTTDDQAPVVTEENHNGNEDSPEAIVAADDAQSPSDDPADEESSADEEPDYSVLAWDHIDEALPFNDLIFKEPIQQSSPDLLDSAARASSKNKPLGNGYSYTIWDTDDEDRLGVEQRPHVVIAKRGEVDVEIPENYVGVHWEADRLRALMEKYKWDWEKMKQDDVLISGHADPCSML